MGFEKELNYFQRFASQLRVSTHVVEAKPEILPQVDRGLREKLGVGSSAYSYMEQCFHGALKDRVIYLVTDEFNCRYAMLRLPAEAEEQILVVGPYVTENIDQSWLEGFVQRTAIHKEWLPVLIKYFQEIPNLRNEDALSAGLTALAECIWGTQLYQVQHFITGVPEVWIPLASQPERNGQANVVDDIQKIERRYEVENRLMQVVSQGNSHKAEQMLTSFSQLALEQRTSEPGRNIKNYSIILNTILRKAVEQGGVHPLYIDRLSSEFAFRIELLDGWDSVNRLWRDMAHKYCLLVKKHSINEYSPLVQKVIARVDFDLSADLTLKGNAAALNVNASYLSAMFKNEMGTTLTDYVNRKRVQHAIFLLNTTKLSVSAIGQRCGIQDDNYFTKIFKKYIGKTPKQFRQESIAYLRKAP